MKSRISSYFIAACIGAWLLASAQSLAAPTVRDISATSVSDGELFTAVGLPEPLVSIGPVSPSENKALREALNTFSQNPDVSRNNTLADFLTRFPKSNWAPAINTNLGLLYLHDGYFSRAIDAWRAAWQGGRNAQEPQARALVDRAVGELAQLFANLGQIEELKKFLADVGDRPIVGSATESFQIAYEQVRLAKSDPRHLYICGPLALRSLMLERHAELDSVNFLLWYRASEKGTNLQEISELADKVKLDHHLIRRSVGQKVPVPSIMHWNVGHFATVVGEANGRFHIRDAVFPGSDIWVTQAALDEEASGFFLVPNDIAPDANWQQVAATEAGQVWGKGSTNSTRPGDAGDPNASDPDPEIFTVTKPKMSKPAPRPTCGMCVYNIKESSVSVSLSDTPVGYDPAIGPSMKVEISYNQREDSQPQNFNFYNVSPKWTLNWLSYVTDDPTNAGANVSRFLSGGGSFIYQGFDITTKRFAAQDDDGSILILASQAPVEYRRLLADGSVEIYAQSDGATAFPRRIFLSQIRDPQGNAAVLNYDAQRRLTSVTDAVGRQTTLTYGLSDKPLLVTKVTDPFGRSAKLTYDATGRLSSITDTIGLTSSFTYDANSLVNKLTTPYGATNFTYTAPGTSSPPRFVQATDPLGFKEREEWLEPAPIPASDPANTVPVGMPVGVVNSNLVYRNSFHWDKSAYVAAGCTDTGGCDYTKARIRHFVHMPNSTIKGTALESVKYPLENRKWYNYPGQTGSQASIFGGTFGKPTAVGRVLDDGSTQIHKYTYDTAGFFNLTREVDPLGRTTSYIYANQIDLSAVTQTTEFGQQTAVAQFTYNGQHRPTSATDAAGQTTLYRYNAAGQLVSETNPLGQKTSYSYDGASNLQTVTNANNAVAATYTYDAKARVQTYTDSEGWSVSYSYDDADRVTSITYPDSTAKRYIYNRLDLASYRDREGKLWQYQYDANRRLTKIIDPSGNDTLIGYNESGQIASLTDAKGDTTSWTYDIQGRLSGKIYADLSSLTYSYENTISRLRSVLDPLGQTKQYAYALDDSLTGITYLNALNLTPNVAYSYDTYFPRLTTMIDGSGTTTYLYQPSFQNGTLELQSECFTATGSVDCSHTIEYAYDELGRVSTRQISGSGPETFAFDAIGRLINHGSDLGAFKISYLGQTSQRTERHLLPETSSLKTTWTYLDNAHDRRLAGIGNTGLSPRQFTNFAFQTTPENSIVKIIQESNAIVASPASTTQAVSFNNLNQIAEVSGQAYTYDTNGNLTSDGERTYSWNAENQLVAISKVSDPLVQIRFRYDGFGRRIEMKDTPHDQGKITIKYAWCGESVCQARDNSYALSRSYYDEGELLASGSVPKLYYGIDQVGSIRRVFQSASDVSALDFDPWGVPLQSGSWPTDFRFAGMLELSNSPLNATWFRQYDPNVGRWLSRDPIYKKSTPEVFTTPAEAVSLTSQLQVSLPWLPIPYDAIQTVAPGDGPEAYVYVANRPLSLVDPYGLSSGGTPGNNQAQNKQVRDICVRLGLSKAQQRQLHDEISGQNLSYKQIYDIAVDMFGP